MSDKSQDRPTPEQPETPDRLEKPERPEQPEMPDRLEKPERPEQLEKLKRAEGPTKDSTSPKPPILPEPSEVQWPEDPDVMTREEAYQILEVHEGANREEIETRYTMLTRRYRHDASLEANAHVAKIIEAYDLLTGKRIEREKVDPDDLKVVLGKERREWRNIFDYGWKPFVVGLIVVALIFSILYSVLTNVQPDYKVTYLGAFGDIRDRFGESWEELLKENDFAENPFVDILPIYEGMDPQTESAMMMKAVLVISGVDGTDLIILDKESFERYSAQGAFADIEDLYQTLQADKPEAMERYVKVAMNAIHEAPDDDLTGDPVPIEEPKIYGLDFSEHAPLQGLGIIGQEQYVAIPVQSEHQEKTAEIIAYLLDHAPELEERFSTVVAEAVAEQEAVEEAVAEAEGEAVNEAEKKAVSETEAEAEREAREEAN